MIKINFISSGHFVISLYHYQALERGPHRRLLHHGQDDIIINHALQSLTAFHAPPHFPHSLRGLQGSHGPGSWVTGVTIGPADPAPQGGGGGAAFCFKWALSHSKM